MLETHEKPIFFASDSAYLIKEKFGNYIEIRPPIKHGDLQQLLADTKSAPVVICDGIFAGNLAITPRECIQFITSNRILIGCSSMGALRAADCFKRGMVGVGEVFMGYILGRYKSDADVATLYEEESKSELTVSLVHADIAIRSAIGSEEIRSTTYKSCIRALRLLPWWERYLGSVIEIVETAWDSPAILAKTREVLANKSLHPKAVDALQAAHHVLGHV
jgi:TfuA protein